MKPVVKIEGLTKEYRKGIRALDGIDLEAYEGEIFGLLGPNGAGKTTTVKILVTLLKPTSGRASVGGYDVTLQPAKVRSISGYLPQNLTSDDTLTGYENLLLYSKLYGLPKGLRHERIKEVLRIVGLDERAGELVKNYSGGMKRRLEIACSLLHKPSILFLDEPTLGLDPKSRSIIWDFLLSLRSEYGITIFLTTNYMEEAEKLCDRVAIIDLGRVIALDRPGNLKKSVGGDMVTVRLEEVNDDVLNHIKSSSYIKQIVVTGSQLRIVVEDGERAVPSLLRDLSSLGADVTHISVSKPTLNDVFIKITGKAFEHEPASSEPLKVKHRLRMIRLSRR